MIATTMTGTAHREAGLQRALDVLGSESARSALSALLSARSEQGLLARGGHLMSEGYPVELTFTTAAPAVARYTADVVHPTVPPHDRLAEVVRLLAERGAGVPRSAVLDVVRSAQCRGALTFGAWVGGRHDGAGDRYKLYVDVPRQSSEDVGRALALVLGRSHRLLDTAALRFVGFDLADGTVELYYRVGTMDLPYAAAVLAAEGLSGRADDLFDVVSKASGWPALPDLPGANWSASVAIRPGGQRVVSVFAHSVALLGRDQACRARLLALVGGLGLDLGAYEEVARPLAATDPRVRHHSMVTFSIAADAPVHIGIGLRPPG